MRTRAVGILSVAALVGASLLIASPASAETVGDFDYTLNADGDGAIVTGYTGPADMVIPSSVALSTGTVPVTEIGPNSLMYKGLTSVEIPPSMKIIGSSAFYSNQITALVIPVTLERISDGAFSTNKITTLVVPDADILGISSFGNNDISSLTFLGSPQRIQVAAFEGNELTTVTIPDSVTRIGYDAFRNNHLTSVEFPAALVFLGKNAFDGNAITFARFHGAAPAVIDWGAGNTPERSLGDPAGMSVYYNPAYEADFLALPLGYTARGVYANVFGSSTDITTVGTVVADGADEHTVTATVIDEFGDPFELMVVGFTHAPGVTTSATTCTTDVTGKCSITATSSTAGNYTVTAALNGIPIGTEVLTFAALPVVASPTTSTITTVKASISADGVDSTIINITARDSLGVPLTTSGGTITATTTLGTLTTPVDWGNGTYFVQLTSTTAGSAVVSFTINGVTATSTLAIDAVAVPVAVPGDPADPADDTDSLAVTGLDVAGPIGASALLLALGAALLLGRRRIRA